jgi:aryl-alcohol dehydrogenase-like predicted oxidoreductase
MMKDTVKPGNEDLEVPKIGLGCMGMTGIADFDSYEKSAEREVIATIQRLPLAYRNNFDA